MDINFEYYKVFYYVARYGNITRAAAALGSNQPNVTRVMKLLEGQLNCRLLVREPRGISLTGEGERLFAHVEAAYEHLMRGQEEIGRQDGVNSGVVEIGATETALHLFLLEVMRSFRMEYPRIRIKVHNRSTPEIMREFSSGRLDFAVITTPFEAPGSFRCEPLCDFREILVGGAEYKYLGRERVRLKELGECPWIGLGRGTATYELYQQFFGRYGVELMLDMEVASSDLLLPLIERNLGIGFVPESLALPLLKRRVLVQIPLDCEDGEMPVRSVQLVSEKGRGRGSAADVFYRYLREMAGCVGDGMKR